MDKSCIILIFSALHHFHFLSSFFSEAASLNTSYATPTLANVQAMSLYTPLLFVVFVGRLWGFPDPFSGNPRPIVLELLIANIPYNATRRSSTHLPNCLAFNIIAMSAGIARSRFFKSFYFV